MCTKIQTEKINCVSEMMERLVNENFRTQRWTIFLKIYDVARDYIKYLISYTKVLQVRRGEICLKHTEIFCEISLAQKANKDGQSTLLFFALLEERPDRGGMS